jgi:hypothetical protein
VSHSLFHPYPSPSLPHSLRKLMAKKHIAYFQALFPAHTHEQQKQENLLSLDFLQFSEMITYPVRCLDCSRYKGLRDREGA